MFRREFLKRATAALAVSTLLPAFRPRKLRDHLYCSFKVPEDRRNIETEFYVPALVAMERDAGLPPRRREALLAAMRESPKGEMWVGRRMKARWGSYYEVRVMAEVFSLEALIYA